MWDQPYYCHEFLNFIHCADIDIRVTSSDFHKDQPTCSEDYWGGGEQQYVLLKKTYSFLKPAYNYKTSQQEWNMLQCSRCLLGYGTM